MFNRIVSDIITIQASNNLNGNLTIQFSVRRGLKMDISVSIHSLILEKYIFYKHFLLFRRMVNYTVHFLKMIGKYYFSVKVLNMSCIFE